MTARADWIGYYDAQRERKPRDLLLRALASFERERRTGTTVDLGCGTGADTAELIARGWDVVAIDRQEEAKDAEGWGEMKHRHVFHAIARR
ncbi:MAG TPA: methyltransferase domain-containing protein [Actinomycetota bacterium]|nr:methyltransferase domain-containing protein [Actinomycetota bacterium]